MTINFKQALDRGIEWVTRERPIEKALIVAGVACLAPLGWGIGLSLAAKVGGQSITISALPSPPELIQWLLASVGMLLLVIAAFIAIFRYFHDRVEHDRRRVFVIEQRGLRDTSDTPLIRSVPSFLRGRREDLTIDLRERIKDGEVTDPEKALERVTGIPAALERMRAGIAPADISTVYGGLSPVPFTFLAGVLLDDESHITLMDWDRNSERWRLVDGEDDGATFVISGIDEIAMESKEVAVTISVSYGIELTSVRKAIPGVPVVELQLSPKSTDGHWSEQKQQRLSRIFLESVIRIADEGVETIHLFIAAPNSVVFRLGRIYDKRNLPKLLVYQYQKSREIEHPWAIDMPVQDRSQARVHYTPANAKG